MSSKHGFLFTREEIERQIDTLYELEFDLVDYLAEGEDRSVYDEKAQQLRFYFECLAESLWKAGVFKSQREARSFIKADVESSGEGLNLDVEAIRAHPSLGEARPALFSQVGLDWQLGGGFAVDSPSGSIASMGNSSQVAQLVQTMVGLWWVAAARPMA